MAKKSMQTRVSLLQQSTLGPGRQCWALGIEPWMLQALGSRGTLFWDVFHHGQQEVCELGRLFKGPLIFLYQNFIQAPVLQVLNVAQFP